MKCPYCQKPIVYGEKVLAAVFHNEVMYLVHEDCENTKEKAG
jgi:hypothetical protein